MKALLALSLAFTMLASPVYADLSCITIDILEEQNSNQVEYDNWTHVYTIVLPDGVTIEVFDYQKDESGPYELLVGGLFINGCLVDVTNNSFNLSRKQIEEFLDFLTNQEQQLNTGYSPVKYRI